MLKPTPRFVGVSEYKDRFKEFPRRERSLAIHYSLQNIPQVRFEGESSYKKDYKPYQNSPVRSLESIKV